MNPLFARFFRAVYRKEPISGFILILGLTDALIGGLGGRGGLLSIGLIVAMLAIVMRWKQGTKKSSLLQNRVEGESKLNLRKSTNNLRVFEQCSLDLDK